MESTDCSQLATAPTTYSACNCACCCEGGSAAPQGAGNDYQHCSSSSSSLPAFCACSCTSRPNDAGCTGSAACGRSCMQADADQQEQLKEVNSVFSAAEAALQAFWRASLARVEMKSESAGSEAAYSQVRTAARSQAAASIAWVLAAASVVLKEDTDDNEDIDDAAAHSQYQGPTSPHYQYPYPMHRPNSVPGHTHNIIRRPDVQLSRSTTGSSYSKSNKHTTGSLPRWEWRPIRNYNKTDNSYTSNDGCMGSPPCPPSSVAPLNKAVASSPSTISSGTIAPISDPHPCGVPSITISSLLPPLINCRISNTPYNQEALDIISKVDSKTTNATTHNPHQSLNHDVFVVHEPCKKAWSIPPLLEDENVAIDIIDTQVVTKTLVEPFHVDKEAIEEPVHIDKDIDKEEEVKKVKKFLDSATNHGCGGEDNTFNFINCATSADDLQNDSKPLVQHNTDLSSINSTTILQGGKNHKKHLKKKQRKASTSHV